MPGNRVVAGPGGGVAALPLRRVAGLLGMEERALPGSLGSSPPANLRRVLWCAAKVSSLSASFALCLGVRCFRGLHDAVSW